MTTEAKSQGWIQRCAQRIKLRHLIPQEEAVELAREMHQALGDSACPERVADELFVDSVLPAA